MTGPLVREKLDHLRHHVRLVSFCFCFVLIRWRRVSTGRVSRHRGGVLADAGLQSSGNRHRPFLARVRAFVRCA
jgi:hypothetical protein